MLKHAWRDAAPTRYLVVGSGGAGLGRGRPAEIFPDFLAGRLRDPDYSDEATAKADGTGPGQSEHRPAG